MDAEIIVVDNASVDRTPQLVVQHFPEVRLLVNAINVGFAKANNQAIRESRGEYVLLLNPDTIVAEDTLVKCLAFMDAKPEAGALGVKMLDGSGQYLPESKRGLPTLRSSFMKMTGLYKLHPRSKTWNAYYQGHIREDEIAKVEVLTGAFMLMRKTALDKTGLLDEDFFMYGEDIDLSYRITKAGYAIYYYPEAHIIHYKGESTKRSSLNYLLTFYQAMLIFIRKHPEFKGQQFLIRLAIYLHGFIRLTKNLVRRWWPLALDAVVIAGCFLGISKLWATYYFQAPDYFRPEFYYINIPLYTILIVVSMLLNGAYDPPYRKRSTWIGFFTGLVLLLIVYALLPTQLRTSRMVLLLGAGAITLLMAWMRHALRPWRKTRQDKFSDKLRRVIIISGAEEATRIKEVINRSKDQIQIIGIVNPLKSESSADSLGPMERIDEIVRVHRIEEIIFSARDVPFSVFTGTMTALGPTLRYMMAASSTMNIVGSMSRDTEGESYALQIHFVLSEPAAKRTKRVFDFFSALIILITSPFGLFFIPGWPIAMRNTLAVLFGTKHGFPTIRLIP